MLADISNSVIIQWFTGTTGSSVSSPLAKTLPTSFASTTYNAAGNVNSDLASGHQYTGCLMIKTKTSSTITFHYMAVNGNSQISKALDYYGIAAGY